MSISSQLEKNRKKKIKEGINFILNHFSKYNVFPGALTAQAFSGGSPVIIYKK
jgi:hypothetical protein